MFKFFPRPDRLQAADVRPATVMICDGTERIYDGSRRWKIVRLGDPRLRSASRERRCTEGYYSRAACVDCRATRISHHRMC